MYFLIGISLVFAYLYAVNLGGSLVSALVWNAVRSRTKKMSRRSRADVLFLLRVMPLATAIVLSFVLLVPSFLLFEPHESNETVSYKLAFVVGLSMLGLLAAGSRIFASWWRTRRLTAEWLHEAEPFELPGSQLSAYKIIHPFPVLAVIGIIRPKIFVATQVLDALDADELTAALAHETGHVASRDNLKRIAMRLCGDMLVLPLGKTLDQAWLEAAESAADEHAAAHSNALELASALVKIGRITPVGRAWELPSGAYLTEPDDASLASRVEDLVDLADSAHASHETRSRGARLMLPILLLALLVVPAFGQRTLYAVHTLTEAFISALE